MLKSKKTIFIIILAVIVICSIVFTTLNNNDTAYRVYNANNFSIDKLKSNLDQIDEFDYYNYSKVNSSSFANDEITKEGSLIKESEQGTININIEKAGLYYIELEIEALKGRGTPYEIAVLLNDKIPFKQAENIRINREYKDVNKISIDESGNALRPEQVEYMRTRWVSLGDTLGYYKVFAFYFQKGENKITLNALNESINIKNIRLNGLKNEPLSYEKYLEKYKAKGATVINGALKSGVLKKQAEDVSIKSSKALFASSDNSSSLNEPYHYSRVRLNVISGDKYKSQGQELIWKVIAPKAGFYNIYFKAKQNVNIDLFSNRTLKINKETPFENAEDFTFLYSDNFEFWTISKDKPCLFYLKSGENEISLSVTMGKMAPILQASDISLKKLNTAYWEILTVIGSTPDPYRDYNISSIKPNAINIIKEQSTRVKEIANALELSTGSQGANASNLAMLSKLLKSISDDPTIINVKFSALKDGIANLGSFINSASEQPLSIDYILISETKSNLPTTKVSFGKGILDGIRSLTATFFETYEMGITSNKEQNATVWIGNGLTGGKDQANALKSMIINDYKNANQINLQLVPPGTLLPATLSGRGPDVALQLSSSEPVNYALRGAVYDISKFNDYNEVKKRFPKSAIIPYEFNNSAYALPETLSFPVMFYRKDILEKLKIDINNIKTWEDLIGIIPIIQKQHMTIGMPSTMFPTFLYQFGGQYYKDNGRFSALNSRESIDAFSYYTDFYNSYRLPLEFSFENRFRTGEMPIGISDYTSYNMLSISAPEIRGLWDFTLVPGTKRNSDKINDIVVAGGAGCVIMNNAKNKQLCWDFIKWWTNEDAQTKFGIELESTLGTAARYNSANINAIKNLPWNAKESKIILNQLNKTIGIEEVPGGYFTARQVDFAFRDVVTTNKNAREALINNIGAINFEIMSKRKEFGLEVAK